MDDEITFINDPETMLFTLCDFCRKYCGDTFNRADNAMLGFVLDNVDFDKMFDFSTNSPEVAVRQHRCSERLSKMYKSVNRAADAFIWRQLRQQDLVKEMTAQYTELTEISDRYKTDVFEEDDFHALEEMLRRTDINLNSLDAFFANEKHKANCESELLVLRGEIEALLEEYEHLGEFESGECSKDEAQSDVREPYCRACRGSGIKSFCESCGGTGFAGDGAECASCGGLGWENCPECNGTGKIN